MKIALISAIVLTGLAAGVCLSHSYALDGPSGWLYSLAFDEDTVYAEGYSDEAFRRVRSGMSESAVLDLLRSPLGEVWVYGSTPPAMRSGMVGFSGEVVDHLDKPEGGLATFERLSIGMTKREVLGLIGEPLEKSFIYSKSQHDRSYRVRAVVMAGGSVLRKRSYFYVD